MFDSRRLSDQAIALAGLFQSIELVQQCARNGEPADCAAMCVVLESVLRIDAIDTPSVYHGLSGLRAAVLWRQCGGSRLQMLLFRAQIRQAATKLLDSSA